tara:strand:- start:191 stop:619 length:429 start_codon:yes stop_codon:yes gene_type:complete
MLSLTVPAVTPAEASSYIALNGYAGWPEGEPEQLTAIRRGQTYIAVTYNGRWADEWDAVPEAVQFAIIEAALRESRAPGTLGADYVPAERVTMRREKLDVLEEETQFSDRPASQQLSVPIIDALLRPLLGSAGGTNFAVTRG